MYRCAAVMVFCLNFHTSAFITILQSVLFEKALLSKHICHGVWESKFRGSGDTIFTTTFARNHTNPRGLPTTSELSHLICENLIGHLYDRGWGSEPWTFLPASKIMARVQVLCILFFL